MNMCQSINESLKIILRSNKDSILIGQDIAFGGVFRCTENLKSEFGTKRIINSPLCEQGLIGFAAGYASMGKVVIAEIQFADYIYPAYDQIVNEIAKIRYRSGNQFNVGGLVIRAPCSAVGHGGLYHSQSPESIFTHTPGIKVVIPRGANQAKGLLTSSILDPNPVIFLEPKILYRSSVENVNIENDFSIPLGKAEILEHGADLTLVSWGSQLQRIQMAVKMVPEYSCEVIDLRTLQPWDVQTISRSVNKTGRLLVSHEGPLTSGFAAEIASTIQQECSANLISPILRVCGFDTSFPLVYEKFYIPNQIRIVEAIKKVMAY